MEAQRAAGIAAFALLALTGCFEPYRVHVPADVLARSTLDWQETIHPMQDDGWLGTKQQQTDYDVRGEGAPPAHLEVFSLRSAASPGLEALMNRSRQELSDYAARAGLTVDSRYDAQGSRTWESGVRTLWLTQEGRVTSGTLFTFNYRVRLVAEVTHDGRSSTSIIALGAAQVQAPRQCPIIGACQNVLDERSWHEMVGDAAGSIGGAVSDVGLLTNLVTH